MRRRKLKKFHEPDQNDVMGLKIQSQDHPKVHLKVHGDILALTTYNNRRSYYAELRNVDLKSLDLTEWLEYFTEGVAVSLKVVKDKVIGLNKDIKFLKERGQIALTKR